MPRKFGIDYNLPIVKDFDYGGKNYKVIAPPVCFGNDYDPLDNGTNTNDLFFGMRAKVIWVERPDVDGKVGTIGAAFDCESLFMHFDNDIEIIPTVHLVRL